MTQFARPIEDAYFREPNPEGTPEEQDSWRNQAGDTIDLWESLIQFVPNDTDYVESSLIRGPILPDSTGAYVLKLGTVPYPEIAREEGLAVAVRLAKSEDNGNKVSCLVELREEYNQEGEELESEGDLGFLLISETFEDLPSTFQEYRIDVPVEVAEGITDFSELYLRFIFTAELKGTEEEDNPDVGPEVPVI